MLHICMDNSPRFTWIELDEVDSTNNYLRHYRPQHTQGMTLVTAEYQTAGHGQAGNTWESERGKNLLFSVLHHPNNTEARRGFILSQAVALGVADALSCFTEGCDSCPPISIKWPNDIYLGNKKMAGILIETDLMGRNVQRMIAGIGININQTMFESDAPNPISLAQAIGHEQERRAVLEQVTGYMQRRLAQAENAPATLRQDYMQRLYRRNGYHWYEDAAGCFEAAIEDIEPDGHLLLRDKDNVVRRYAFKEVRSRLDHGWQE